MENKKWSLEEAKKDYDKTHKNPTDTRRSCKNCKFASDPECGYGCSATYFCNVKSKYIEYTTINALTCKYFTLK